MRKSKDLYTGIGWERNMDADSAFFADFAVYDTLKIPLAELLFDKEKRLITTRTSDPSTTLISDQMIVYNKSTLDKFYDQIFDMIVNNRKGSQ